MDVQKIHKRSTVELHKQSLCLKAEPEEHPPSTSLWSEPPPIPPKPAYTEEKHTETLMKEEERNSESMGDKHLSKREKWQG